MNSINWPASSVWVVIAQAQVEHCSANAEATGVRLKSDGHILISLFHSFHGLMSLQCVGNPFFRAFSVEHCSANAEAMGSNPVEAPKSFFSGFFAIALIAIHCDGHILISFVFPQFTSFHSVYHEVFAAMEDLHNIL